MSKALGEHEDPNPAAASRRGLFGQEQDVPRQESVDQYAEINAKIEALGKLIVGTSNPNDPSSVASGSTDGSGNAVIGVYEVAAGMEYRVSRIVIEVSGYTPSAPYIAVGFAGVYALPSADGLTSATATVLGTLRDVAAGSATQAFLPAIFEYNDHESPRVRGPFWLAVVISAGPASKQVTVYHQGSLRRMQGIA